MATGSTETLNVTLPSEMVNRLRVSASQTERRVDEVVAEAVDMTVAPCQRQIEEEAETLLRSLAALSDSDLERKAEDRLSRKEQSRLSALLSANGERKLTVQESEELEALMGRVQTLATEGVAARWILGRRRSGVK